MRITEVDESSIAKKHRDAASSNAHMLAVVSCPAVGQSKLGGGEALSCTIESLGALRGKSSTRGGAMHRDTVHSCPR